MVVTLPGQLSDLNSISISPCYQKQYLPLWKMLIWFSYGGMQWWTRQTRASRIQLSFGFAFDRSKIFKDSDLADVFFLMNPHQHLLVLSFPAIAILWWLEVQQFECMAIWIYCDLNGCGVCIQNHPFRAVKGGSSRRLDLKQICNIFASFHDDEDEDSRQANLQYFLHLLTPTPSKQTFSSKISS